MSFTQAQIVPIPDANFKAALISSGVDTNSDGEIQESEALAVTSIRVYSESITSMEGLVYFVNITSLQCFNNQLTSLDVSQNVNLKKLKCHFNQLSRLDFNQNLNLEKL